MTTTRRMSQTELDQLIADEFGVNADYVSVLLSQFEQNPASVDEEWREYFNELLGKGATGDGDAARPATEATVAADKPSPVMQPATPGRRATDRAPAVSDAARSAVSAGSAAAAGCSVSSDRAGCGFRA